MKVTEGWHRKSPSLGVYKRHLDIVLSTRLWVALLEQVSKRR